MSTLYEGSSRDHFVARIATSKQGAPGIAPSVLLRQIEVLADDIRRLAPTISEQVRELLLETPWAAVDEVYLTGSGDSYAAACAAGMAYETFAALHCEPLAAHRFVEYTCPAMHLRSRRPLVIAASASGRTPRVVEAIECSREKGALTLAITGGANTPAAAAADASIIVDLTNEERSPGVRTYQASLLAMLLLAVELGIARGVRPRDERAALDRELEDIATAVEATAAVHSSLSREHVEAVAKVQAAVVVGSGPNYGTALFSAAKLVEAAGIIAVPQDLEEWWHIERRVRPLDVPLFVTAAPGRSHSRAGDVVVAAHALGRRVFAIAHECDVDIARDADLMLPVCGDVREEFSPLLYHIFAASTAAQVTERLGRRIFEVDRLDLPKTLDGFRHGTITEVPSRIVPANDVLIDSVLNVLRRHGESGVDTVADADTELTALGLDSLALVALIVDLEKTFAVVFPSDALEPKTFHTARTIADAVNAIRRT